MSQIPDLEKRPHTETARDDESVKQNIVDWDGPDDPANPMNWGATKKNTAIAIASAVTFVTYELPISD